MVIAFLSPSRYSSVEKKSKLESMEFRLSCEDFFVDGALHPFCQERAPLLVIFLVVGLDWVVVRLFGAAVQTEGVKGLAFFGLLTSVKGIQFPSVFPLCGPSLSVDNTPTSSTAFPSLSPLFWASFGVCSSGTSLEFRFTNKAGLHLGEVECEEDRECWECLDSGVEDRSER